MSSTRTESGTWAFDRSGEWSSRYGKCSNKSTRTAPLNIDTNKISPCNALCRLSVLYNPTTCSVSMVNNIPTVSFSPNSYIKFKNEFFYLRKMTIHYTSLHTINEFYYDLEILLYHNRNPVNDADGGVIISILMKKGADYGTANEFMNEFINQMPANEMPIEEDISVSSEWSVNQILPDGKSFFYYDGALPYPPCNPNWSIIVFEEAVEISQNIINTVKQILGGNGIKNIRPIQRKPSGINIFYNANTKFDNAQEMILSDDITQATPTPPISSNLGGGSWMKRNIYIIKGIIITIILLMMIYVAIKLASIIVKQDILNDFIIRQLKHREERQISSGQEQMRQQQIAESGGIEPVQRTNTNNLNYLNNNGNANNNNNDKKKK